MRRITKLALIIMCICLASKIAAALQRESDQPFSITISAKNTAVHSGESIPVHVVMTNISAHAITVSRPPSSSLAELHFKFEVQEKTGRLVPETAYRRSIRNGTAGSELIFTLNPGEKMEEDTDLAKLFDLTTPGTYRFRASRTLEESTAEAHSNELAITVTSKKP